MTRAQGRTTGEEPSPAGLLGWWFASGIQRLVAQGVSVLSGVVAALLITAVVPATAVSKVEAVATLTGGAFVFAGGSAIAAMWRTVGRPAIALSIIAVPYVAVRIYTKFWLVSAFGMILGVLLLTTVEFGLRGLGQAGLSGDDRVRGTVTGLAPRTSPVMGKKEVLFPLLAAQLGFFLFLVAALLEWFS